MTPTSTTEPAHRQNRATRLALVIVLVLAAVLSAAAPVRADTGGAQVPETVEAPSATGLRPVVSKAGFTHPGVYVNLPVLEFVRQKISSGAEPWTSVFRSVKNSSLVGKMPDWRLFSDAHDTSRRCDPLSPQGCVLDCDTTACKNELRDQINSAYTNALLWYYSGDESYARNAVTMLNAYAHILRGFTTKQDSTYTGILEAAMTAQTLIRAAEIIRYTYRPGGEDAAFDVRAFAGMLRSGLLPLLRTSLLNERLAVNNWRTSAIEGIINAAVFLDDRSLYRRAVGMWRETTSSYVYLASDGKRPPPLPDGLYADPAAQDCYWLLGYASTCKSVPLTSPHFRYQHGQSLEICRDFWHASAGLGGIVNTAETAYLQGDDLYGEERGRIMSGISYILQIKEDFSTYGYPAGFCGDPLYGQIGRGGRAFPFVPGAVRTLSDVVAFNHYKNREGLNFPSLRIPGYTDSGDGPDPVAAYITAHQSGPGDVEDFVVAWQVLTHYGVGDGLKKTSYFTPTPTPTVSRTPTPTVSPLPSPVPTASRSVRETTESMDAAVVIPVVAVVVLLAGLTIFALLRRRRRD